MFAQTVIIDQAGRITLPDLCILSKSKDEVTRCIGCLHQDHLAELPRPYATLKFKEDTDLLRFSC